MCHTRATVPALLEFLCKWMPLHLFDSIAALVCEETQSGLYKVNDRVRICHAEVIKRKMISSQLLYYVKQVLSVAIHVQCHPELYNEFN